MPPTTLLTTNLASDVPQHLKASLEYIRGGESVVRCIALYKHALKNTKVKLCNTTQSIPQTSGAVTAKASVVGLSLRVQFTHCNYTCSSG